MGLDAHVCCNCYELGKLREPPPVDPQFLHIDECGHLDWDNPDWKTKLVNDKGKKTEAYYTAIDKDVAFYKWVIARACEHKDMVLLHHRIGNDTGVYDLYKELSREAAKFPILLEKVLYSGTHSGGCLSLQDSELLKPELEALADFQCKDPEMTPRVTYFRQKMIELVDASLSVGKPISF